MDKSLVVIKGAGDLASGVAQRLYQCGFAVLMLETQKPTVIRRTVAYAQAVYQGEQTIEGVQALFAADVQSAAAILYTDRIAVLVDPHWEAIKQFEPQAVVDAIMAKKNLGTSLADAPLTIGLGPGFTAGRDVAAVIETNRGHDLGRVIYQGSAAADTGIPGEVGGYSAERLLRAPCSGQFMAIAEIGQLVREGQVVATVGEAEVHAPIAGVLRGILTSGLHVPTGFKIGDIDPRAKREHCFTISDKARSVAGGVVEALLHLGRREQVWMIN